MTLTVSHRVIGHRHPGREVTHVDGVGDLQGLDVYARHTVSLGHT